MIIYHYAFDLNHAAFRIMVLLRALGGHKIEPEKLRILDFYYMFPRELPSISHPEWRMLRSEFGQVFQYEEIVNPSRVFYKTGPVFYGAIDYLKAHEIVKIDRSDEGDELIHINSSNLPDGLAERLVEARTEASTIIDFLVNDLAMYPLHNEKGLKDRTKLLPYKNDRKSPTLSGS